MIIMRSREQIVYDINLEQFKHLKREENIYLQRVDVNELNKRLNRAKRSNFYSTALVAVFCFFCLTTLCLISIKF